MKRAACLTPGEFELMEILWLLGEGSVRDVKIRIDQDRHLAYTTVMTVLDKMRKKGLLHHRKQGKAFLYSPAVSRHEVLAAAIDEMIDTYFNGSRTDFLGFVNGALSARQPAPTNSLKPVPDIEEFLL